MDAYLTAADAKAIVGQDVDAKYLEYASDALDEMLGRFDNNRLWYHEEEVVIDLKEGIKVYRPKITPIQTLSSQKLLDKDGNEVGDYEGKIWTYNDYIRLERPVWIRDKYKYLKLSTISGFFDKNAVPVIIKQFVAKLGAKLQIEAADAGTLVSGGQLSGGGKKGFTLGDYSVNYGDGETNSSLIKTGSSENLGEIGGGGELDMIYSKYGRVVAGFIY